MVRALLLSTLFATAAWAGPDDDAAITVPFVIEATSALRLTVAHAFERPVARERITYLLNYWAGRFGVKNEWHGDRVFLSGKVWGVEIRAVFTVQEKAVQAIANDPRTMLASAAQGYVYKKLRKYLHPTYEDP
jgi:hypothetical protein